MTSKFPIIWVHLSATSSYFAGLPSNKPLTDSRNLSDRTIRQQCGKEIYQFLMVNHYPNQIQPKDLIQVGEKWYWFVVDGECFICTGCKSNGNPPVMEAVVQSLESVFVSYVRNNGNLPITEKIVGSSLLWDLTVLYLDLTRSLDCDKYFRAHPQPSFGKCSSLCIASSMRISSLPQPMTNLRSS